MDRNICFVSNEKYIKEYKNFLPDNFEFKLFNKKELYEKINISCNCKLYDDYIRIYHIYNNGGLILDGKFKFITNIDLLLDNSVFLGYKTEDSIATNILWANKKNDETLKLILDEFNKLSEDELNKITITELISRAIKIKLSDKINSLVKINSLYIYPYDFFYPIDYEKHGKRASENTKLIYFEDNQKLSIKNKFRLAMLNKFGQLSIIYLQGLLENIRFNFARKKYNFTSKRFANKKKSNKRILDAINILKKIPLKNDNYIIFHNPNWLGVTSATKELFDNLIPIEEIYDKKMAKTLAMTIVQKNVKQVIFSAFGDGWDILAREIKRINKTIKIKVFWHGSNSQVIDTINWRTNVSALNLHKEGIVDVFATCKESLVEFYKSQGYNTTFIKNTVVLEENLKNKILKQKNKQLSDDINKQIRVGIYSANMAWRKNMFNQICATSLIEHSSIHSLPLNFEGQVFASKLNQKMQGNEKSVSREVLLEEMSKNDLNLYVTFSECAPMLPIESMEVGTLCISGNNHHYFKDTELEKYLIVDREDDVLSIYDKIQFALQNKGIIFDLYNNWKKEYDKESKESVKIFLNM